MEAENRRTERRADIIDYLNTELGLLVSEVVDLTAHEDAGHYLEGTGSMVLDRVNRVAYACLSSRTHLDALGDFAQRMDYDVITFDAVDSDGVPIYHRQCAYEYWRRAGRHWRCGHCSPGSSERWCWRACAKPDTPY